MTEPGRERRAQQVAVADAVAQRARDLGDEVPDAGVRLGARRAAGARRVPVRADAPEVVAHQVDDHHVLGAVLRRGRERARGAVLGGSRRVPLIGARDARRGRGGAGTARARGSRARPTGRRSTRRRPAASARAPAANSVERRRRRTAPSSRRQRLAWKSSPAAIRSHALRHGRARGRRRRAARTRTARRRRRAARRRGRRRAARARRSASARGALGGRRAPRTTSARRASRRRTWS